MPEDPRLTEAVCREIAGRQRYLGGPKKIADVLGQLMARRGYARVQASSALDQVWRLAAGEALALVSRPGNLRRGVLQVVVANSAALQELGFAKRTIIKELKQRVPDHEIRDIRFRIGPLD